MTLGALLALFGFPFQRMLGELQALAVKYPDLAPVVTSYQALLAAKASPAELVRVIAVAGAELKDLVNRGEGPVTRDPVDIS